MGIGVSIFLLAVGAILTFATSIDVSGLDLQMVGVILMIVGGVGLLFSLIVLGRRTRHTDVIDAPAGVTTRRRVIDE